jgi:hypothetical protein
MHSSLPEHGKQDAKSKKEKRKHTHTGNAIS